MINVEALSKLRKQRNLSYREMAKRLGYKSHATYYKIERGQYKIFADQLPLIAKALNLPLTELIKELYPNFFNQNVS